MLHGNSEPSSRRRCRFVFSVIMAVVLVLFVATPTLSIPHPISSGRCTTHRHAVVAAKSMSGSSLNKATDSSGSSTSTTTSFVSQPNLFGVRGGGEDVNGQVLAPTTLEDVEAILVRAGGEGKLVVIDFSAVWCGPCKMIAPLFAELSESMTDVVFIKVDVDENPDTAAKYNVSAMPTFVFIKGGQVVDRLMGANPARLQELIEQHKG